MPAMTIDRVGFGAGTAELDDRPNLTQVVIGQRTAALASGQPVVLLEVNVDDATGEQLADAVGALLDAGAHDAWLTPIVMKKGRPAYTVSALADPTLAGQVADVLTRTTGSLGVRGRDARTLAAGAPRGTGRGRRPTGPGQGRRRSGEGRARRRRPGRPADGQAVREVDLAGRGALAPSSITIPTGEAG